MGSSFYNQDELVSLGLKEYGENVLISRKCSLYSIDKISIGSNVRIDDFCLLSGNIVIGNYIHISAYSSLIAGQYGIVLEDFSTISSRCSIFAESDDYSGQSPTNPTLPDCCRTTYGGKVLLKSHAIIGSGCTVLPNVTIGEGAAIGAMSLVNKDIPQWGIYAGVPCRLIRERSKNLLQRLPGSRCEGSRGDGPHERFLELAASVFDVNAAELSLDTAYKDFAPWDSIAFLQLVMEIEQEYSIKIPMERFGEFLTLGDFYQLLSKG